MVSRSPSVAGRAALKGVAGELVDMAAQVGRSDRRIGGLAESGCGEEKRERRGGADEAGEHAAA